MSDQAEKIILEAEDQVTPVVGQANAGLDSFEKKAESTHGKVIRITDQTRTSVQRLIASLEKQADTYGKSGVDRLVSQRDQLLQRYSREPAAIDAITKSYEKMIAVEEKAARDASAAKAAKEAEDALRKQGDAIQSFGNTIGQFMANPLQGARGAVSSVLSSLGPFGTGVMASATALIAFGAAGFEAAKSLGEYGTQVKDMELRTGLAAKEVGQFGFAAKAVGQDASIYERMMRGLAQAADDTSKEGEKARTTMQKLGVTMYDSMGAMKPTSQILEEISGGLARMPNALERDAAAMALFKRAGVEAIPVITELSGNKLALNAGWDEEMLRVELESLKEDAFHLDLVGFSDEELDVLLADPEQTHDGLTDEDAVPEAQENAVTQPGDVWLMGEHRLLCGDSTALADVEKLMAGSLADMTFTDPPYGVNYGQTMKDKLRGNKRRIANDNLGDDFGPFLREACINILAVTKGAVYICMSSSELHTLHQAFAEAGGHWSTFVIWAKNAFTMGRADYQRQYEPILYGWKEGTDHFWCGARDQGDVWFVKKPVKNDLHPTMKPVELVERALRNSSKTRDTVLDPFGGSGTTLIACEKTGRQARVIELEPKYVDVIIQRWQAWTAGQARHEASGRTFDDLAAGDDAEVG